MKYKRHYIIYLCFLLNWIFWTCRDDQILFNGILYYLGSYTLNGASYLPFWRTDGVVMMIFLHALVVEFLYYWLHRAFHHHYLYSRYHSHHHSSIVTEPITCESPFINLKLDFLSSLFNKTRYETLEIQVLIIFFCFESFKAKDH